jgi:hypothetical protein
MEMSEKGFSNYLRDLLTRDKNENGRIWSIFKTYNSKNEGLGITFANGATFHVTICQTRQPIPRRPEDCGNCD